MRASDQTESVGSSSEVSGYRTQILEFIDMEHTPKNIMIRAILEITRKQTGRH